MLKLIKNDKPVVAKKRTEQEKINYYRRKEYFIHSNRLGLKR